VRPHYGVRTLGYKLVHYLGGTPNPIDEWELFDLRKDPQEMNSVYADASYAATRIALTEELTKLRKDLRVPV
jgi:arylsulfatase A-like enzyme